MYEYSWEFVRWLIGASSCGRSKAEGVGAIDALMLKVPADGVGFFGIDGLQ